MAAKRLKIAFLSMYSGIIERGVETLIPEIAKRIGKKHDLVLFQGGSGRGEGYKVVQIPTSWKSNVLEYPLNIKRRLFLDPTSLAVASFTKKAIALLKNEKFDIVVPWNNGWQALLCKVSRIGKVVVVGQSGIGWDDRVNLWLFPDVFVGFTSHQTDWARKINRFVKTVVIANGVDLDRFKPQGESVKLNLPKPIILSVAALVPVKRLHLAIAAVSRMETGSLVLVGKGELRENLEALGQRLLPGRFKIISLPYQDIDKVYRSADVFTFPTSSWESFGIVLLEAMASGLSVVSTDDPIRREIVGNAGLFVDPANVGEYARTLESALAKKWADTREQAKKYSWDQVAESYIKLFEELVVSGPMLSGSEGVEP